jgi:hypothetical protein
MNLPRLMQTGMKTKIIGLCLVGGLLLASGLFLARAQTQSAEEDEVRAYIELLRSDVNSAKIETLNEVMRMRGPEAEKFWPVYRNYERELAAVSDRKLELIREFAALHLTGALRDAQAKDLAERWLKNTQDRLDLWKKYHKRISKAVSPIRGAQFLQVEHQMALFVDLNIAAEMPAVGAKPPSRP